MCERMTTSGNRICLHNSEECFLNTIRLSQLQELKEIYLTLMTGNIFVELLKNKN